MTCDLCQPSPHQILWQDDFCRVVLLNDADYPAYCRVELLEHIKEMTDLASPQRARIMKTVFAVELALREVTQADKSNLARLGNKTPPVHWPLMPRFVEDKHFPNSHWGEAMRDGQPFNLDAAAQTSLKQKIKAHIECALLAQ